VLGVRLNVKISLITARVVTVNLLPFALRERRQMSELRYMRDLRGHQKVAVPKSTRTGLSCPCCKGHTVQRDVSSEDRWYVEYCVGGIVRVSTKVEGREIFESVPCEYWGCGFEPKR